MEDFEGLGLSEALVHRLQAMGFEKPTPIQEQAIPLALKGRDILGSAQTGTGKTGAFGIPIAARMEENPDAVSLIMTPTRELATQVMNQVQGMISRRSRNKVALLIGGEPYVKQLRQLRDVPRLIVGTPGRINDHLRRKSLKLNKADFLVLDETDRMLDMGFSEQIEDIIKVMAPERQTLLFSATLPKNIVRIADTYLTDPERVAVGETSEPAKNVKQDIVEVKSSEKYPTLLNELETRTGTVIIFVKTKIGADELATKLSDDGHKAQAIHGDLPQRKRDRVLDRYRDQKFRILVATDIAARGLDVPHIEHVVNYDLPQAAEDYIHRIGRTARAGAEGHAICLIAPHDWSRWNAIDRLMNPDKPRDQRKKGKGRNHRKGGAGRPRGDNSAEGGERKFGARSGPRRKGPGGRPSGRPGGKPGGFKKRFGKKPGAKKAA
ncbi:DEAD/DEAH box helicase [Sneathiella sp. P13V-1]|uniref:DEAD/DEAH box helicase n=1 Tax=Sneathiella sp. P13V-1 TaxID=2697366 RepID=UPI00187B5122|nr:DEAD/DEAH box helicase [Sneathiella sp. P13V-1]MBE7637352.1 DEAD/DEAH box helicase [Sneathiella sp. P13V-1]